MAAAVFDAFRVLARPHLLRIHTGISKEQSSQTWLAGLRKLSAAVPWADKWLGVDQGLATTA